MSKEQLAALTVVELKAMAKKNGLKGYSKLRKAELIELLATEVTFEEVCNKAPEELHYWNGENMKRFILWDLKKEKNVINGKEYDLVLYYNNKWHTIIKSDEIDMSSILATISLEMQDDQLKVMTKGFELLKKEVLEKVKPKLLEGLPKPLKQQLSV